MKHSTIWQCICLEGGKPLQTIALTRIDHYHEVSELRLSCG